MTLKVTDSYNCCNYIGLHNHSDKSNFRLIDAINKTEDLIKTAVNLGYKGIAITDHECLSAHVEAIKFVSESKKETDPKKLAEFTMPQDFKLILGNEIYLVNSLIDVRDNYQKGGVTKFPHFILLACDAKGHEQLRKLSSIAWENSFTTGLMERTPTEKSTVERIIGDEKGHLIATSSCIGSELAINVLRLHEAEINKDDKLVRSIKVEIDTFIKWCINMFGKSRFFIELQPAYSFEQKTFNKRAVMIAKAYDLKTIVATDSHFLRPEDLAVHKAFLNSKDGDRETESFYEACFLQTIDEMTERLSVDDNLPLDIIRESIQNTMLIGSMVEDYDLQKEVSIPKVPLPDFEVRHIFQRGYEQYPYLELMANSKNKQDNYLMKLVEDGFDDKEPRNVLSKEKFHGILARINAEFEELWHISLGLSQAMSAYYVTIRDIINMIWDECGGNSLVGAGRGSAVGFYINYLLDITQVNPLDYNLPHWRHLHKSRKDFPDIDLDTEASKRGQIIQALKNKFTERRVLNICTFGTEKSKSAIQTACRGLGIDIDVAMYISSLIPFERGENWSLSDCLFGNEEKNREAIKEFITEIDKYDKLRETALKIEGLVNKRSIHASGVYIYNDDFTERNAMMRAPNGQWTTQFSMNDSDYMGGLKYDFLTVEGMDKLRKTLDFLVEYDEIEWKGNLRSTYNHYIHPNTLDYTSPKVWEVAANSEIIDLFQFNTQIGMETIKKVQPTSVLEMSVANSLMRLMAEDGDAQPVETYAKYKDNINLWYDEMRINGLSEVEMIIMDKHLKAKFGVADSQESVMTLVMDEQVGNLDVEGANILRKAIAKRKKKDLIKAQELFFSEGAKAGTSHALLDYVWNVQVKRQIGYSFSDLHNIAYTIIGLQEINLYLKYDPIYWNTAVLTVNSASGEDETSDLDDDSTEIVDEADEHLPEAVKKAKNKSTNYGKVASAIGTMQSRNVKIGLPSINYANFGFKPDIKNQQIIYGLKGLVGVGDDAANAIVSNRPYNSFEHFIEKLYDTSILKNKHLVQLIKAGAFTEFEDRVETMKKFITKLHEPKSELTMQNFNGLMGLDLIPKEFSHIEKIFNFRKHLMKNCVHNNEKNNKTYKITDEYTLNFFNNHFPEVECTFEDDNHPIFSEKLFKKAYDKLILDIKPWLAADETLVLYNQKTWQQLWDKHASGTISKWEMDSLSFYYTKHELAHVNKEEYQAVNFFELPEEAEIESYFQYRDTPPRPKFKLTSIMGTVLDKDKNKHTVTLLTTDGVVTVKYYDGVFAHYNKTISEVDSSTGTKKTLESSWFTRGNKLFIHGYRRGSQFKPHKYKDSYYQHTTYLITDISEDGKLTVKDERIKI